MTNPLTTVLLPGLLWPGPLPTIAAVTTTIFALPLEGELKWGKASRLAEARHVLVEVTLSDGSQGVAEAPPRPTIYGETEYTITAIVDRELAPRLVGKPAGCRRRRAGERQEQPHGQGRRRHGRPRCPGAEPRRHAWPSTWGARSSGCR